MTIPIPLSPAWRTVPRTPISETIEAFQKWLYLPDAGVVTVTLGAVAANLIEGRPVWLLLVGPPGSGKTEVLNALLGLPNIHSAATLTESALLSGTPKREKAADASGGLLREIGEFGLLVCKDLTSVLSMNRDQRAAVLSALREIYDGAWTRRVGTDGGRELSWRGKVGLLGGVTPVIDSHHSVMASMGERFLLYRLPDGDPELQALTALRNSASIRQMTAELFDAVRGLFASELRLDAIERSDAGYAGRLIALTTLAAHARSAVERDGRTREVELVPAAEMPARLTTALAQLDSGMAAIGVEPSERWRLVCKVALDCVPDLRRRLLVHLLGATTAESTTELAARLDYPTQTVRRALEDLTAHHLLTRVKTGQGSADLWQPAERTRERWRIASVPDLSGGQE